MEQNIDPIGGRAVKSGVWYTISSILSKSIIFLTTPIFTRIMSVEDFGIAATFTSWYLVLGVIFSLNLMYSIGRAKLDFPGKLEEYTGSMIVLATTFSLVVFGASFFFQKQVTGFLNMNWTLAVLMMIYLLASSIVTFKQASIRYQYQYKGNVAISLIISVGSVACSFALFAIPSLERYLAKIIGSIIPSVFLALVFTVQGVARKNYKISGKYWKYGLIISVPLIFHSLSINLLSQIDRVLISRFCGDGDAGIYSLAYQYTHLVFIVLSAVNEAWLPWFHDTLNVGNTEAVKKNVQQLITFGGFIGFGCVSLAPEIMAVLGTEAYTPGLRVVAPLMVAILCGFVFQQYEHVELHYKKTWYISVGTGIAAAVNYALNWWLIPKYGFVAAAYTTMASYVLVTVIHWFINRAVLKKHIYQDMRMFLILFAFSVVCLAMPLLYERIFVRFAVLLVACAAYLAGNRRMIKSILANRGKTLKPKSV